MSKKIRTMTCILFLGLACPLQAKAAVIGPGECMVVEDDSLAEGYEVDEDGSVFVNLLEDEEFEYVEEMEAQNIEKEEEEELDETAESAIDYAYSKLGYPYSMQRRSSGEAYDCSSLVYYAYKSADVNLSNSGDNTAAGMAKKLVTEGKTVEDVEDVDDLEAGDLIFYSYKDNGRYHNISHVAMYVGDGKQIEASSKAGEVVVKDANLSKVTEVCSPTTSQKKGASVKELPKKSISLQS